MPYLLGTFLGFESLVSVYVLAHFTKIGWTVVAKALKHTRPLGYIMRVGFRPVQEEIDEWTPVWRVVTVSCLYSSAGCLAGGIAAYWLNYERLLTILVGVEIVLLVLTVYFADARDVHQGQLDLLNSYREVWSAGPWTKEAREKIEPEQHRYP